MVTVTRVSESRTCWEETNEAKKEIYSFPKKNNLRFIPDEAV